MKGLSFLVAKPIKRTSFSLLEFMKPIISLMHSETGLRWTLYSTRSCSTIFFISDTFDMALAFLLFYRRWLVGWLFGLNVNNTCSRTWPQNNRWSCRQGRQQAGMHLADTSQYQNHDSNACSQTTVTVLHPPPLATNCEWIVVALDTSLTPPRQWTLSVLTRSLQTFDSHEITLWSKYTCMKTTVLIVTYFSSSTTQQNVRGDKRKEGTTHLRHLQPTRFTPENEGKRL